LSTSKRNWVVSDSPPASVLHAYEVGTSSLGDLPARLLYNRGFNTPAEAHQFLNAGYSDLSDPSLLPGIDKAAARLISAIERGESIGIVGDFDVDGLTGAALLLGSIEAFGGKAVAFVPDRQTDGHGVPISALSSMHASGVSLVITADTGTSELESLEYAASLGLDVVVTDHHVLPNELPAVVALVNPHLGDDDSPAAGLTGAGVAFKLVQTVGRKLGRGGASTALALAALGTVADVGPLRGDNRIIVREGLKQLENTEHAGLRSLIDQAKVGGKNGPIDAESVAFQIGPRLNAPGRLGNARDSLDLLVCDDPERALMLAEQLEANNLERRRLSGEAQEIAAAAIAGQDLPPLISVVSDRLHPGLLGPAASRLAETHSRPAMVGIIQEDVFRASLRSGPEFDIHAALQNSSSLFEKFGGHARAGGFTAAAADLEQIIAELTDYASTSSAEPVIESLEIDAEIDFSRVGIPLKKFLDELAPFGEANPTPLFLTRGLMPMEVKAVGATGDHLKLALDGGSRTMKAIGFGMGRATLGSGLVDAVYSLKMNYWRGRESLELSLVDIRPSE
jgi:single-stranded-DNA-specific exonuclease